jgi:large subunit ribosomal protein L15
MKLHNLRPDSGAKKPRKRVGRGLAAGQGKTSGRGTKGQGARSGGIKPAYFEGGSLPLVRKLPFRRGFTNPFRVDYAEISVERLADLFAAGGTVSPDELLARNVLKDLTQPVVVLGTGEIGHALTVKAHRFTATAKQKIEKAGGTVEVLEWTRVRQPR